MALDGQPFDSTTGRLAALVRHSRRVRLDEDELGPLETPADARRWAKLIVLATLQPTVSGSSAQACASLLREWREAYNIEHVEGQMGDLRRLVQEVLEEVRHGRAA